ncbi:vitelline envelope sperm lysin receptor [Patella vulgata]|uniref:vitelline envelope sperm lysin receptor n=1 Tax=Patella vulgata TaxID=6465 RepID=UPI0021803414|nr:vitelline envelope sperm lysin receptor [Patella vulgata]XP_050413928.1 vitelline envelope sperm lysin receptor [Patella vulgata]
MNWFVIYLSLLTCCVVGLEIPKGYVLDIKPTCSNTTGGVTTIQVLTDLELFVEAECANKYVAQFSTINYVDWSLEARYTGDNTKGCIFDKKQLSNTYLLRISVSWAEPGNVMLTHEVVQITCTLDTHGISQSKVDTLKEGLLGATELQSHMGGRASSSFTLQLTDIDGKQLPKSIALGRKVQLHAKMLVSAAPGAKDEKGLRAVNCAATAGNHTYKILRGGCGDGLILPSNKGFNTIGTTTTSPVFSAFRLAKLSAVSFRCNFTTCKSNCDGDSCEIEKRRRRALIDQDSQPEDLVLFPVELHVHVRSVGSADAVEIDPCKIPGLSMEGCKQNEKQPIKKDFPIGVTSLMITIMVLFPVMLIVGLAAFFCCTKNKNSYGITDDAKSNPT